MVIIFGIPSKKCPGGQGRPPCARQGGGGSGERGGVPGGKGIPPVGEGMRSGADEEEDRKSGRRGGRKGEVRDGGRKRHLVGSVVLLGD